MVFEVIVDEMYKKDLVAPVRQYRWRYDKDKTPLSDFKTRIKVTTRAEKMFVNATRLLNRSKYVLSRVQHPLVQRHFQEMQALAQLAVQRSEAEGASVDPEMFRAPRKDGGPHTAPPAGRSRSDTARPAGARGESASSAASSAKKRHLNHRQ